MEKNSILIGYGYLILGMYDQHCHAYYSSRQKELTVHVPDMALSENTKKVTETY